MSKMSELSMVLQELKECGEKSWWACRAVKEAYRIYTRKRNLRITQYINLEFSMK